MLMLIIQIIIFTNKKNSVKNNYMTVVESNSVVECNYGIGRKVSQSKDPLTAVFELKRSIKVTFSIKYFRCCYKLNYLRNVASYFCEYIPNKYG